MKNIKTNYIKKRLNQVDSEFLSFEESMISSKDLDTILALIDSPKKVSLPNPHNSIILYICGLTNEFDFEKARADTVGGSPPDLSLIHISEPTRPY